MNRQRAIGLIADIRMFRKVLLALWSRVVYSIVNDTI